MQQYILLNPIDIELTQQKYSREPGVFYHKQISPCFPNFIICSIINETLIQFVIFKLLSY